MLVLDLWVEARLPGSGVVVTVNLVVTTTTEGPLEAEEAAPPVTEALLSVDEVARVRRPSVVVGVEVVQWE